MIAHSSQYLRQKYLMEKQIPPKKEEPFIPIYQTGGIGDLIVSLPFLETFRTSPIPIRIYTNFPDIAKYFLKWPDIRANALIDTEYKLISSDLLDFKFKFPYGPEVLPQYLNPIYAKWSSLSPIWGELINKHPHKGNEMATLAVQQGLRRWSLPFLAIDQPYEPFPFNSHIVENIDSPKKFITVHDGFGAGFRFDRSMKSWDIPYWEYFIFEFKRMHRDIAVVQLGLANETKLKGVDYDLTGKLSFEHSLRYLKSSLVHVDTDSGLVHARKLFNKPSIVIFGPTNPVYFGYPGNSNLAPLECGDCWWKKNTWMEKCVLEKSSAVCMQSTKPDRVLNEINLIINEVSYLWK